MGDNTSKREHVKKKWSKFKHSVRQSRRQLKIHRKSADQEVNSDYEDESAHDDSSSSGDDLDNQTGGAAPHSEEEVIQPPVISSDAGYYWIGKDYYNTYKAGSKDISDFSKGKLFFFYNS
jgi:hypothetical protein